MLLPVIVNFFDRTNSELAPREIWVAESPVVPVEVTGSGSAADEFSASVSLSQLLPAAIQNDSPMKGKLLQSDRLITGMILTGE